MILDLVSPHDRSLTARVVISDRTGEAVLDSGEGADLVDAIAAANDSRHGGIEQWVPTHSYLVDWAEARGILVTERGVPGRVEVDPDVVY